MVLENLYILTLILGFGVVWAGARTLSGYRRNPMQPDDDSAGLTGSHPAREGDSDSDAPAGGTLQQPTITFAGSGRQFSWDPTQESLLDFIESKGIAVDCLCRAGECGSCRTRLIEGEVVYRQPPKIKPGKDYCLLCISRPKSDIVLDR